jgi:uncharacterized protein
MSLRRTIRFYIMAQPEKSLHESGLSAEILDRHRAIASAMEELEAVDWYDQRIEAATDPELRSLLEHNRDEEKEHAAMVLEWLRRNDAGFDRHFRKFLFSNGPIREQPEDGKSNVIPNTLTNGSLGIGSMKE